MIYKTVELNVDYDKLNAKKDECKATLTTYVADYPEEIGRHNRPAMLIIPGGGYDYVSDREGEPIAMAFLAKGVQCFVLRYSVQKAFPVDLIEAATALKYIRENAYEFDINPDEIGVMGFSAGGHLAASLAVLYDKPCVTDILGDINEYKPNRLVLAYPVISTTDTHQGSIDNLLREPRIEGVEELISLEKQVSSTTPKTYIWHCQDDGLVPVSNSLRFADALNKAGVDFAMHIYAKGEHGLALANEITCKNPCQIERDVAGWVDLVANWIFNN